MLSTQHNCRTLGLSQPPFPPFHHLTVAGGGPPRPRACHQGGRQWGFHQEGRGQPTRGGSSAAMSAAAQWGTAHDGVWTRSQRGGGWHAVVVFPSSGDGGIRYAAASRGGGRGVGVLDLPHRWADLVLIGPDPRTLVVAAPGRTMTSAGGGAGH
jgi:hypothetical protein